MTKTTSRAACRPTPRPAGGIRTRGAARTSAATILAGTCSGRSSPNGFRCSCCTSMTRAASALPPPPPSGAHCPAGFSPHNRHDQMLAYESNSACTPAPPRCDAALTGAAAVRGELLQQAGRTGWFTTVAVKCDASHGAPRIGGSRSRGQPLEARGGRPVQGGAARRAGRPGGAGRQHPVRHAPHAVARRVRAERRRRLAAGLRPPVPRWTRVANAAVLEHRPDPGNINHSSGDEPPSSCCGGGLGAVRRLRIDRPPLDSSTGDEPPSSGTGVRSRFRSPCGASAAGAAARQRQRGAGGGGAPTSEAPARGLRRNQLDQLGARRREVAATGALHLFRRRL